MAEIKTLLIGVKQALLSAVTGTGASLTFGLPTRVVRLAWQLSYDVAPAAVSVTLEVSMDNVNWTVIDTSTAVGGEVRTVANSTAAIYIRANVGTNTGNRAVTVNIIAKVPSN